MSRGSPPPNDAKGPSGPSPDAEARRGGRLPPEIVELIVRHRTTLAATASAIVGVGFGFPFDALKTRMQTSKFPSMDACLKHMYRTEGINAFYRGCLPTIGIVALLRSVTFFTYHRSRETVLHRAFPLAGEDPKLQSEDILVGPAWQRPTWQLFAASFIAGAASGAVQASINAPMELIKIARQLERVLEEEGRALRAKVKGAASVGFGAGAAGSAGTAIVPPPKDAPVPPAASSKPASTSVPGPKDTQTPGSSRSFHTSSRALQNAARGLHTAPLPESMWDRLFGRHSSIGTAMRIVKRAGVGGLYTGLGLHVMRDTLGTGLYWMGYESFKHNALLWLDPDSPFRGPPLHMVAGALAGCYTWLISFPIDLVKSVVQKSALISFMVPRGEAKRKTAWGVVEKRMRVDGIRGLYFGIGATLVRAAPIHALNFLVYEKVLELVRNLRDQADDIP
ncbi:mitochondrial carrier domain-containing protein [Hyaloraphidium curvatum]|nr:mitochondrial carrier domain-containing protein [Hyaloraphidium curvatum]